MTLLSRVVLIVLVALLPALAAEIYNQQLLRWAEQAELRDDSLRAAQAVGTELRRVLDGTRNALVALASLPPAALEDRAACATLLYAVRERFAFLSELALVSADDRLVCASQPKADQAGAPADWPQVRAARRRGHFAVSGYMQAIGGAGSDPGLLGTALPVLESGRGAGPVLVGNIGLDRIARPIALMARQDATAIVVLDRQGRVLLATPTGPVSGSLLPTPQREAVAGVTKLAIVPLPGSDGRPDLMAVDVLPDLVVVVRPATAQAAGKQTRVALRSYLTFAAGLLAAIACAALLARHAIARPVARILRTIALWRLGAHQPRVVLTNPHSELGRIGRALNDLLVAFEQTEAELRASKAELEQRVETRTRQLEAEVREREATQALLQQSQKMEVIGQLTGGVAHDFNNLLTAILGNLELAGMRSADRPEVKRLLDNAARAANRGASLTQRMLAFGRRQFLQPQAVDLAALLAGMDDLLARTIGPTVRVEVRAAPDLWLARADPNQLELVILNLAINARDAMPQGGRLSITAANVAVSAATVLAARLQPGDYVSLTLRDDGSGMDRDTLARVLEPFFTTKPAGKGSGLGLSMAHGVAAQLGGDLVVSSVRGVGTTVQMWLPRDTGSAPEAAASARSVPASDRALRQEANGTRILLVDDDPEVAEVTLQCLRAAGYAVHHAPGGAEALAMIADGMSVDLLLADLAMPGMNGVQLANHARARLPGLKVLLATGYVERAAIDSDRGEPFPVLSKPFRSAQLLAAVAALLDPKTSGEATDAAAATG